MPQWKSSLNLSMLTHTSIPMLFNCPYNNNLQNITIKSKILEKANPHTMEAVEGFSEV